MRNVTAKPESASATVTDEGDAYSLVTNALTGTKDTCSVTVGSSATIKNAATYTLTASTVGNTNYTLASSGDHKTTTFTVNKATISASWSSTSSFTYSAGAQGRTLTISGLKKSETITFTASSTGTSTAVTMGAFSMTNGTRAFTGTNAGSYGVQISNTIANGTTGTNGTASNYTFAGASTTWTINKATLKFSAVIKTSGNTYTGSLINDMAKLTISGIKGSDTVHFAMYTTASSYKTAYNANGEGNVIPVKGATNYTQTRDSARSSSNLLLQYAGKLAGNYSIATCLNTKSDYTTLHNNYQWSSTASDYTGTTVTFDDGNPVVTFSIAKKTITLTSSLAYFTTQAAYTWGTYYGSVSGPANKDSFVYSGRVPLTALRINAEYHQLSFQVNKPAGGETLHYTPLTCIRVCCLRWF